MSDNWEMTRKLDDISVTEAATCIRLLRCLVDRERALKLQLVERMQVEGIEWPKIWEKP